MTSNFNSHPPPTPLLYRAVASVWRRVVKGKRKLDPGFRRDDESARDISQNYSRVILTIVQFVVMSEIQEVFAWMHSPDGT